MRRLHNFMKDITLVCQNEVVYGKCLNGLCLIAAITQFYDIRGLSPYTEYEFVVLGVNNVGRGDKSEPILLTTGDPDSNVDGNQSKSLFLD